MHSTLRRARTSSASHTRQGTTMLASLLVVALSTLGVTLVSTGAASAAPTSPTTYKDYAYPSGTGEDGPTADKPQSKLWFADGSWYALMVPQGGSGVHIQRLTASHTWVDTGTVVDSRTDATSDALFSANKLYTVSRTASGDIVVNRFSFSGGDYSKDPGYAKTVGTGGTESASLDKDTTGALWVVWTKSKKVMYSHSDAGQSTFTAAASLPVPDPTVYSDDIAGVIAFQGKIGVFWSDHATGSAEATTTSYMRFATHTDGTGDSTSNWSVQDIQTGKYSSDDHLNLKTFEEAPDGTVYIAFKTSFEDQSSDSSQPQIVVVARKASGSFTKVTAANVGTGLTRPQLLIDKTAGLLYVFMTAPTAGGTVYAKTSPLSSLSFSSSYDTMNSGKGTKFVTFSGAKINNVSVSKDPVTSSTGIVALASDTAAKTYYHAEQGSVPAGGGGGGGGDTTAPTAPSGLAATVTGSDVKLTWTASTDNVAVTGYQVFRNGTQVGTTTSTTFTNTSVPAGTYSYTVKAVDAAGNVSAASNAASATVEDGGGGGTAGYVGSSRNTATAASSISLSAPSGTAAGNTLLVALSSRGTPSFPAPAGWTKVRSDALGSTETQAVFSHTFAAGESSYTFQFGKTATATVGQIVAYDASGVASSAGATGSSATLTAPSLPSGTTAVTFFSQAKSATLTAQSPLTGRGQATATGSSIITASSADADRGSSTYSATSNGSTSWIAQSVGLNG